jgi:hypothetical protein
MVDWHRTHGENVSLTEHHFGVRHAPCHGGLSEPVDIVTVEWR